MKAFSRIPDPFTYNFETFPLELPFKTALQIEALPQGKIHHNVVHIGVQIHHIIKYPTQHKSALLSIDLSKQFKEETEKKNQNTAMTQGNQTSKELEGRQKLNEVEKCPSKTGQNVQNLLKDAKIERGFQKSKQTLRSSRKLQPYQLNYPNLPQDSNQRQAVSHIVFQYSQQQISKIIFHKRPIFTKDKKSNKHKDVSPASKNLIKQEGTRKQVNQVRIGNRDQQSQEVRFLNQMEQQVEGHIECSFFNISIKKEGHDQMKNTRFDLIESVVNIFKDQPKQPKFQSLFDKKTQKQRQNTDHINQNLPTKKDKVKNLGGLRLKGSKVSKRTGLQMAKLELINSTSISPVFF